VTEVLTPERMLPAPGQGAIAVQCRSDDPELLEMLRAIHHEPTAAEVGAERAFLGRLEAGCSAPVAALARYDGGAAEPTLHLVGRCLSPDGTHCIELEATGLARDAEQLGRELAERAIAQGFFDLPRVDKHSGVANGHE
jgi:hydroxymethylbilane synthase